MSALTSAQPIMWVKLTLPPRARRRWLLITIRLSIMSFAGIVRTLVAVGMESDASMFVASDLAMPRSGVTRSSVGAPVCAASVGASAGMACRFGPEEVRDGTMPGVGPGRLLGGVCEGAGWAGAA